MKTHRGNAVVWVLVIIVILGLAWWLMAARGADDNGTATTTVVNVTTDDASLEDDMIDEIIITYGPSGFSPSEVTINRGQTVRWLNQGGGDMWVATAMHPTHTVYPGSDIANCDTGVAMFDQCENSASFEFTFNEIGEWGYHNHSQATHFGKVIVQ